MHLPIIKGERFMLRRQMLIGKSIDERILNGVPLQDDASVMERHLLLSLKRFFDRADSQFVFINKGIMIGADKIPVFFPGGVLQGKRLLRQLR